MTMLFSGKRATIVVLAFLLGFGPIDPAHAATLIGADFAGVLYDIDPANGAASNPRPTGLNQMAGFTVTLDGQHAYALTSFGSVQPNALFRIDLATGAATLIGSTGLSLIGEGDLAIRPGDGQLFAIWNAVGSELHLLTLNTTTGAAIDVGPVASSTDLSGLTFGPNGALYCYENSFRNQLLVLDPATGATLSTINLVGNSIPVPGLAALAFNPASGTLYMAGNGNLLPSLYTIDLATGATTLLGPTFPQELASLAVVPEPTTVALLLLGLVLLCRPWRRMNLRPSPFMHRRDLIE
jgi:DNA-binding beta-propeller fold protein YncE